MTLSKARNALYKAARALGDLTAARAVAQGNRRAAQRRAKNKMVGRLLGPLWRRLWK